MNVYSWVISSAIRDAYFRESLFRKGAAAVQIYFDDLELEDMEMLNTLSENYCTLDQRDREALDKSMNQVQEFICRVWPCNPKGGKI